MCPVLSICIATYNRSQFIGESLDSILSQILEGVELIVVDGASPDNTPEVMSKYILRYPNIRYYREQENSGIDKDYDKAVSYAKGDYCWLMTDDDLLHPTAIKQVLNAIKEAPDLVVVNSEIRNANLTNVLQEKRWPIAENREYKADQVGSFFSQAGSYLSFIGAVVIRREIWLVRDRAKYYGTLFIHFGVIFQHSPIEKVYVIAEPLIVIRYGNAMWTSRGFEIWMFKWPELVWSFDGFVDSEKQLITPLEPWRSFRQLFFLRATGAFSSKEFFSFISPRLNGIEWVRAYLTAIFPANLANLFQIIHFSVKNRADRMAWYELLRCRNSTKVSHWVTKFLNRHQYNRWICGLNQQPTMIITNNKPFL